jgi:hypothetical protein
MDEEHAMNPLPQLVERSTQSFIHAARRLEPFYRDHFDRWLKPPLENVAQALLRLRLKDQGLSIAEETIYKDEEQLTQTIIDTMNRFLIKEYRNTGKVAERAGNTKTYGLVKAVFKIRPDLPEDLHVGLFQAGKHYPAYIRFGGPGPRVVADAEDNGILSIGIKVMGVPGKKLLDDERFTVDFSGISSPSFTTPTVQENVKLQQQIGRGTPAWYFLNPLDSHLLDMVMQGLYARIHANPLALRYYSCVPYLYGSDPSHSGHKPESYRAIKFVLLPSLNKTTPPDIQDYNFLRHAMIDTLSRQAVSFDFAIQFQTDPINMPIEDASIIWSEKQSPLISIATIEIPQQDFTHPEQDAFARNLTFNPWHTLPELRPLGNQNRARKYIYLATSRMRQKINSEHHLEPTGDECFEHSKAVSNTKATSTERQTRKSQKHPARSVSLD